MPILLGVMFSYALTPAVDWLQRRRLPRPIGATLVLGAFVGVIGWGAWALSDDASALIETLPRVAQKVRQGLDGQRGKPSTSPIDKVQQAANELEQAAQHAAAEASARRRNGGERRRLPRARHRDDQLTPTTAPPPTRTVTRVVVERPAFNMRDYLWSGTLGLFVLVGQVAIVLFVTLFLLASGDTFRRKMVKLAGPRLSQKKITVQALDEVRAADPALPAGPARDERRRRRRDRPGVLRARLAQRRRVGRRRGDHQPRPLRRRARRRLRIGVRRLHPVRQPRPGRSSSAPARSRSTPSSATS